MTGSILQMELLLIAYVVSEILGALNSHAQSPTDSLHVARPFEAQALDTLHGRRRDVVTAKVTSIANGKVHVKRQSGSTGSMFVVPFSDIDFIRFADGFRLDFQGGELLRDNVLSAPFFEETLMHVKAEGVLALSSEEIMSFYGPGYFNVVYRPYRAQTLTGFGKLGIGILGSLISFPQRRTSTSSMEGVPTEGVDRLKWPIHYNRTTTYDPFWTASSMFFLGTTLAGVIDYAVPQFGFRKSLQNPIEDRNLPTIGSSKGLLWGGLALSAVGIGTMAFSYADLKAHPSRAVEETVAYNHGQPDLKPETPWAVYAMLGGALAANLGFSAIQLGATRLSALRRMDDAPYAIHVNVGPSPSGYGLTMRF